MERSKRVVGLELSEEEIKRVSELLIPPHKTHIQQRSFHQHFSTRGIRLHRVTDQQGNLAPGAIANIVDGIGYSLVHKEGSPMDVIVNMSITYLSSAKLNDEVEITSRLLSKIGLISGTIVSLENKATGEIIAEGRLTMFSRHSSKI